MTAGKRRELHALETELETISHREPAQLLEEDGYVGRLPNYGLKSSECRLSTPLIYAIKIMKNGLSPPARR
ncbi:putative cytoplasmic protein [Salmonella enterica subsp. enterica]|uniref:Putative cytoplasmic protein n=1 Tax=Salmonella enterica I TaxID=59201 RepID=A0A379WA61_SALET|nr:putative cytoplasmic protein [Salmonella enterica subsp. enterica]